MSRTLFKGYGCLDGPVGRFGHVDFDHLPKNGDDNGAFNIARKGIMVLDKISEFVKENGSCEKLNWGDLYVSNQEWDDFVSKKK